MNIKAQNSLYAVIILFIIIISGLFTATPKYQVHGIFLPTTSTINQPVNEASVQILKQIPPNAHKVGNIRTMVHFSNTKKTTLNDLYKESIIKAKSLAAKNGSNAIAITMAGRTKSQGPLDGVLIQAIAYKE
jgi:hypothetical protein